MHDEFRNAKEKREEWDLDDWGVVINGPRTFESIARILKTGQSVATGWAPDQTTMHSLVLTTGAARLTYVQGLHRTAQATDALDNILFVSVLRCGAFGFDNDAVRDAGLHPDYVAEKLGISGGATAAALAERIHGVMNCLQEG